MFDDLKKLYDLVLAFQKEPELFAKLRISVEAASLATALLKKAIDALSPNKPLVLGAPVLDPVADLKGLVERDPAELNPAVVLFVLKALLKLLVG